MSVNERPHVIPSEAMELQESPVINLAGAGVGETVFQFAPLPLLRDDEKNTRNRQLHCSLRVARSDRDFSAFSGADTADTSSWNKLCFDVVYYLTFEDQGQPEVLRFAPERLELIEGAGECWETHVLQWAPPEIMQAQGVVTVEARSKDTGEVEFTLDLS